jgi:hypothetical protein
MIPWSTFTFADHHFTLFSITHGHIPPSGYYRKEENRYNRVHGGIRSTNRRRTAGNGRTRNQVWERRKEITWTRAQLSVSTDVSVCYYYCDQKKVCTWWAVLWVKYQPGHPGPSVRGHRKMNDESRFLSFPFYCQVVDITAKVALTNFPSPNVQISSACRSESN